MVDIGVKFYQLGFELKSLSVIESEQDCCVFHQIIHSRDATGGRVST